jgi:hypothetical protein
LTASTRVCSSDTKAKFGSWKSRLKICRAEVSFLMRNGSKSWGKKNNSTSSCSNKKIVNIIKNWKIYRLNTKRDWLILRSKQLMNCHEDNKACQLRR